MAVVNKFVLDSLRMAVVNKYVLDSSVANLVLDGELWERCPCALVPYKVELQAALFCVEGGGEQRKIGDIVPHTQHLPRAISASSGLGGCNRQEIQMPYLSPQLWEMS